MFRVFVIKLFLLYCYINVDFYCVCCFNFDEILEYFFFLMFLFIISILWRFFKILCFILFDFIILLEDKIREIFNLFYNESFFLVVRYCGIWILWCYGKVEMIYF